MAADTDGERNLRAGMQSRRVPLPRGVRPPFEVYVNGVRQAPGEDYDIHEGALRFHEPLVQEGRIGAGGWFLGFWGVGTYKRNDEVDVRYEESGQPRVAAKLPLAPE
jgi:hypothetical protein